MWTDQIIKTGRNLKTRSFCCTRFGLHASVVLTTIFLSPAFFSCEKTGFPTLSKRFPVQIYILRSEKTTPGSLDLFFFHDDELQRLDAYQRIENPDDSPVNGIAGSGKHLVAAISNFPADSYSWKDIQSFTHLTDRQFHLEDENPENPFLFGLAHLEAGLSRTCKMSLRPMLAALTLRSVSCDFSGKPYEGKALEEVSIFLINVTGIVHPLDGDGVREDSFINPGFLDRKSLEGMAHPEMLYQELGMDFGAERKEVGCTLYAYPNPIEEESLGKPFTRFVIEGVLDGKRCYYPINIPSLYADRRYNMDITLTRMGSPDPDTAVEPGTVILEIKTRPWAEFDEYTVRY